VILNQGTRRGSFMVLERCESSQGNASSRDKRWRKGGFSGGWIKELEGGKRLTGCQEGVGL
jgi:hypothetical protein